MFNSKASPEWRQRWAVLLKKLVRVQTADDEKYLLQRLSQPERPFVLAFANAHAMNSLATSGPFFDALASADMVLRDGSGMATLYKLMHLQPGLNLNGTDLIPALFRHFNGRPIAMFGTQNPYLERGAEVVAQTLAPNSPQLSAHGFLHANAYVALARKNHPALIVLGMGMPRQEQVAATLRVALTHPCLIVCGGAIIDFLGGKTSRAPAWIRHIGLEWAYRLAHEPRRLFRRYVIGNPLFLSRALRFARHVQLASTH